jgi:3-hydroxyacyl-[acyl-carrier-protein] dehydratase
MKFNLIDKVESLSAEKIVAVKYVSLAEEYLADHFPTFPVLPGVMMLEAATQAAGWLLHHRYDFARSMAVLREARNVKYGRFVAPGAFLRMDVQPIKIDATGGTFKAVGSVGAAGSLQAGSAELPQAVQMRLEMRYFDLAEQNPELSAVDAQLREHHRRRWELIRPQNLDSRLPAPAAPASIPAT